MIAETLPGKRELRLPRPLVRVPRGVVGPILDWYRVHGRALAIRGTADPYAILVAEVMAQQTQISRVEPAWHRFIARFPTVASLAAASTADVIRAWAGLGYNGRAVRLQRAAQAIVERHAGRVPDRVQDLLALPGVGPYTARAVAATAFGRPAAPVDTNVRRVVGRIVSAHGRDGDPRRPLPPAALQAAADRLVPRAHAAAWTHALMDLGSTICRPVPRCSACPAVAHCAYARATVESAPTRRPRRAPRGPAFPSTSRWLRGRLLALVRVDSAGGWIELPGRVGSHGRDAVETALGALARDGLVEWRGGLVARLPIGGPALPPASGANDAEAAA